MMPANALESRMVPLSLLHAADRCHAPDVDFSSTVLAELTALAGADGCVLWEEITFGTPEKRYFALAEWFERAAPWHFLSEQSLTHEAVKANSPQVVDNVEEAFRQGRIASGESLREARVSTLCAIPIQLAGDRASALTFYRKANHKFSESQVRVLSAACQAVPFLFHSIRNAKGLSLLRGVSKVLGAQESSQKLEVREIIQLVAEAFNACEVCLYLQTPGERDGHYSLIEPSRWPWSFPIERTYRKGDGAATAWVIKNNWTVRILDVRDAGSECTKNGYEGLHFRNGEGLVEAARQFWLVGQIPPLSFLCVPVRFRGKAIGALRCSVARKGPYCFDQGHADILELVADQLGDMWGRQMALYAEQAQRSVFVAAAAGIDRLTASAFLQLEQSARGPDSGKHLDRALEEIQRITRCGEALSIRLVDEAKKDLYYEVHRGRRWEALGDRRRRAMLATRYPLSAFERFHGCRAIREKRSIMIDSEYGAPSFLFPETTWVLNAPILIGDRAVGVIDIRAFEEKPFPPYLADVIGLVGRQLGVHLHMFKEFETIRASERLLQKTLEQQSETYSDFEHQINNPIQIALSSLQRAMERQTVGRDALVSVRSNLRRAEQVAGNIRQFVELAADCLRTPDLLPLDKDTLLKWLEETLEDLSNLHASRELVFKLDQPSFAILDSVTVLANLGFLEHCLINLLDNAAKYSKSRTEISVRGARLEQGTQDFFAICVANRGLSISSTDKGRLFEKGVRGDAASFRQSGRGLGLYLVAQFMKAMGGSADVIPTDSRGINEFRLIFPIQHD